MKAKNKKIIFIVAALLFAMLMSVITAFVVVNITNDQDKEPVIDVLSNAIEDNKDQDPDNGIVKEEVFLRKETLSEIIAPAKELVAAKYYYTNASDIENYKTLFDKKIPLTTDKQVFTYDGVIMAGIDLEEINYDDTTIDNENKKIHIILPYPKIISHEIDHESFKFYDVQNSIFTSISPSETTESISKLEKEQEEKLYSNKEFWESVSSNSEMIIERFIKISNEAKEYDVTFAIGDPHDPKYDAAYKKLDQLRADYKELEAKEAEYLEGFENAKQKDNKDVMGMFSVQLGEIRSEKSHLEEEMQKCQQTLDELEKLSSPAQ